VGRHSTTDSGRYATFVREINSAVYGNKVCSDETPFAQTCRRHLYYQSVCDALHFRMYRSR